MPGLYTALDAMALLACREERCTLAARIAYSADVASQIHGHSRRPPAAQRIRTALEAALRDALGSDWLASTGAAQAPLREREACELALGLRAE
jgi:hypothetical protein